MPKVVKREAASLPGVAVLTKEEDRYAEAFKATIRRSGPDFISCFFCLARFVSKSIRCGHCKFSYGYCGKHREDISYIFGCKRCLFCERKYFDAITSRILGLPLSPLSRDAYCRADIDARLAELGFNDEQSPVAQAREQSQSSD
jgi:hypothetical protein